VGTVLEPEEIAGGYEGLFVTFRNIWAAGFVENTFMDFIISTFCIPLL
jgi:hypothetical protein